MTTFLRVEDLYPTCPDCSRPTTPCSERYGQMSLGLQPLNSQVSRRRRR